MDYFVHPLSKPAVCEAIDPAEESQILLDRQVSIKAERLIHVSNRALDRLRFPDDIQPIDRCRAGSRLQYATQHSNAGAFSAAIGTKKAKYCAFSNVEAEIINCSMGAKSLCQLLNLDGVYSVCFY